MNTLKLAAIVIIPIKHEYLCISRRNDNSQWGFPGGKVDEGESTIDCAVREVYEELGLKLDKDQLVEFFQWTEEDEFWTTAYTYKGKINLNDIKVEDGFEYSLKNSTVLSDPKTSPFANYNKKVFHHMLTSNRNSEDRESKAIRNVQLAKLYLSENGFKAKDYNVNEEEIKLNLIKKALGPRLVCADVIEDCMSTTTKKGVTTHSVDYMQLYHKIEEAYDINITNLFGKDVHNRRKLAYNKYCEGNISDISKLSPADSFEAAKMRVIDDEIKCTYYNFWHKLLDNDFVELHNGSFNYMSFEDDLNIGDLYDVIKYLFKKECSQVKLIENDVLEEGMIKFWVEW